MQVMEGAWWTFFKWLKVCFCFFPIFGPFATLLICLSSCGDLCFIMLFTVFMSSLVIKWTKMLLACVVVLEDPLTKVQPHHSAKWDIRYHVAFDCRLIIPFNFLRTLSFQCYWHRHTPAAKIVRRRLSSVPPGFYFRLRLQCRISKTTSRDTSRAQSGPTCGSPGLLSSVLERSMPSFLQCVIPRPQEPATLVDSFQVHPQCMRCSLMALLSSGPGTLDWTNLESHSPPTFLDHLLLLSEPHLEFRYVAHQRRKLLRSLRFSSSRRTRNVSALVASTELMEDLWPRRAVTPARAQAVAHLSKGSAQQQHSR